MKTCKNCTHPVICESHGCGNDIDVTSSNKKRSTLVERLLDEADLCRNEGVNEIANLLEEAALELSR